MTDVRLRRRLAHRLIPTRYPSVGILDRVAAPEDLDAVFELEAWTNDRISTELGILLRLPREEWVTGAPMASVVMAAFCHPRPGGSRFNDEDRGAWYASFSLETAHGEAAYHRGRELKDVGITDARLQMRAYTATFSGTFSDIRADSREHRALHDPDRYDESQRFARGLRADGAAGLVYRSVRQPGGTCLVCFRPYLVANVTIAGHYEYVWHGGPTPTVRRLNGG